MRDYDRLPPAVRLAFQNAESNWACGWALKALRREPPSKVIAEVARWDAAEREKVRRDLARFAAGSKRVTRTRRAR